MGSQKQNGGNVKRKQDGGNKFGGGKRPRTGVTADKPQQANWEKNAEIRARFNKLYNQIQKKELSDAERQEFVQELWELVKGKIAETASRHDTSRCLQSLCRFGTPEMRSTMLTELSEKLVPMSKGSYSSFLVIGFLKYGDDDIKLRVLKELKNHFVQLSTHSTGARVVDAVMRLSTDSSQVTSIRQRLWDEFFGQEYVLFARKEVESDTISSTEGTGGSLTKDKLEGLSDKQQARVIQTMGNLVKKQADKGLLRYAYAQQILNDYLNICSDDEMQTIIPTVRDACIAMASSPMGVESMVKCIEFADAKERKKIVKLFKSHVLELASHEFAYKMVLATLQWLDDTVLLQKSVLAELFSDEEKLLASIVEPTSCVRKILFHLIAPGSKFYFSETDLELVNKPLPASSRKDSESRQSELLKYAAPLLVKLCAENLSTLIVGKETCDLVTETFKCTAPSQEIQTLVESLSKLLEADIEMAQADDEDSDDEQEDMRLLEHPVAHVVYKRCLLFEAEMENHPLADSVCKQILSTCVEFAQVNRPAMVLVALMATPSSRKVLEPELKKGIEAIQEALTKAQVEGGKSKQTSVRGRGLVMLLEQLGSPTKAAVTNNKTPKKTPAKLKNKRVASMIAENTEAVSSPVRRSARKKKST